MSSLESEYPQVMLSIYGRLSASDDALKLIERDRNAPNNWMHLDFVTLQVRKVCELFLLGATLAHLREAKAELDPRKWRPKDAFSQLSRLSTHPLPMPLEPEPLVHENGARQLIPMSKPLPFKTLSAVYGHCGDLLHVPSAEKVLSEAITPFDWMKFRRWVDGFLRLVSGHALLLPELNKIIVCFRDGRQGTPPSVFLLEADGPSTLKFDALPEFGLLEV